MKKLRWVLWLVGSVIVGFLAIVYGKRTPSVIRMKLRELKAREDVLVEELEAAGGIGRAEESSAEARRHLERVAEIDRKLIRLRAGRDRYISSSRDLPYVTDDDLAVGDNARSRSRSGPG